MKVKHRKTVECSVCGESGDGHHFGAPACRACAAFFRRTVADNRRYTCRSSSTCVIHSSVRGMCKSCRYQKCIAMGMRRTAVLKVQTQEPADEYPCTSSSVEDVCVAPLAAEENMIILKRMCSSYESLQNVRTMIYAADEDSIFATGRAPRAVPYTGISAVQDKDVTSVLHWFMNCFPDLNNISFEERTHMFRNVYSVSRILEAAFVCIEKGNIDVFFLSNGDYIDYCNSPSEALPQEQHEKEVSTARLFRPTFEIFRRTMIPTIAKHGMDMIEMVGLCGLLLWDVGLDGISEFCERKSREIRNEIMKELLYYFSHVKHYTDPSLRLGHLILLPNTAWKIVRKFQDIVEITRVFDLHVLSENLYDLVADSDSK